ncbi:MAG: SCO family protein [Gammaproteobacteria bacterium]|nr:SCO family protein [Gammaproteobacteria bacterium]
MRPVTTAATGLLFGAMLLGTSMAWAHGTETHEDPGVAVEPDTASFENPLPLDVRGEFELIDHNGHPVSNRSYSGKYMLVFFGYTSCRNMCPISLDRIGKALGFLGDSVHDLAPLIITVDPQRDTPEVMRTELPKYHPSMIGLTGNAGQLETVYTNFNQSPERAGEDWNNDPIVSHSSYIYLLNGQGELATLFPPILNPQSMADIIRKYMHQVS